MSRTALRAPAALVGRVSLIVTSVIALVGAVFTYALMALHLSSLRMLPGTVLPLAGAQERLGEAVLPAGMRHSNASMSVQVDLVAYDVDQTFLAWQVGAWISRYGLGIVVLLSVVYLSWRLWRRGGLGRAASWWAGSLGALVLAVAVLAPWALIRADQLFAQAIGAPTEPEANLSWFVVPEWSVQDADWWLILFAGLLLLLSLLLRRAHRAEDDTQGLI
ncbi:hypothetical protein [Ornithinimicrobium cavernae]|uniref:hypothetical protein n=1 Tax=Ornithinimicrobium cavernae TaxID=2666047 RepID=UPI000D692C70|nr:hypothetical protein [Ornithinimicrobium cavernae]